jgi:hypothetical protein
MNQGSYMTERCAAIIARTSVSLIVVSSNPGVSINVTRRPSNSNGSVVLTPLVHDSICSPTLRFEPLMRLINYGGKNITILSVAKKNAELTDVFPVPVGPIILSEE